MGSIDKSQHFEAQFEEVLSIIDFRKTRAYRAVNNESIISNWEIGQYISDKLKSAQWGSKVVDMLANYLQQKQPGLKGYDRRAIYRMVQFYEAYSVPEFVGFLPPQLQLPANEKDIIVGFENPQLENEKNILSFLCLVNWTNHIKILSGCNNPDERAFYIYLCYKEKLLTRELDRQIKAGVYERSLIGNNKQTSVLKQSYPTARQYFKDSYIVDFLNLPEVHSEKSLHKGLTEQMKNFILELGRDFIFIGEEYRIQVGMKDFRIDLLFYHRGLQCLVAIELKTTEFQPDYIGQLDFYLEALDRDVKKENENPSIGILLCKSADSEVVEYALSRSLSPSMIAEYKRQLIPKDILQKHLQEFYDNVSE